MIGKVIEVFIPNEYINNQVVDIMDCKNIGFKVKVDDEIIEIIEECNEENAKIMKDDVVFLRKQVISGKTFIDIELLEVD